MLMYFFTGVAARALQIFGADETSLVSLGKEPFRNPLFLALSHQPDLSNDIHQRGRHIFALSSCG